MNIKEITEYCNNYIDAHELLTNTIGDKYVSEKHQVYLRAMTRIRNHSLHCVSTDDLKIRLSDANKRTDDKLLVNTINAILIHNFNLSTSDASIYKYTIKTRNGKIINIYTPIKYEFNELEEIIKTEEIVKTEYGGIESVLSIKIEPILIEEI